MALLVVHFFDGLQGVCPVPASEGDLPQVPPPPGPGDADISFIMHSAAGAEHGIDGAFSMGGLARLFAQLHIKTLCFVHFFSGHRRVGDLQHQIESHFIQDHTQLFCLSVDFCLQGEEGNLVTAKSRTFWAQQIKSGAIIGCGGGPPCETFTAACLLQGGPPPTSFPRRAARAAQQQRAAVAPDAFRHGPHAVHHRDGRSLCLLWWLRLHRASVLPNMGQTFETFEHVVFIGNAMAQTAQLRVCGHF